MSKSKKKISINWKQILDSSVVEITEEFLRKMYAVPPFVDGVVEEVAADGQVVEEIVVAPV